MFYAIPMRSTSRLWPSTQTDTACAFLQREQSSAWPWWCLHGGVEVLAPPHSLHGICPAAEIHQKAGKTSRAAPCSRLGCCLLCGHDAALSLGQADPPRSTTSTLDLFKDSGSTLPFFIKEGISLSGLSLAPWWFLPSLRALLSSCWSGFNKQWLCSRDGN